MRKPIIIVGLVLIVVAMLVAPVLAQTDTGEVSCTVSPRFVAVSVDPTSVDYGVLDLSSSAISDLITATNDGKVDAKFEIKGADSTTWTLAASVGVLDEYMHEFALDPYSAWTALDDTVYATLAASVAPAGEKEFKLQIWTPSSTTDYGDESTTVTILATDAGT